MSREIRIYLVLRFQTGEQAIKVCRDLATLHGLWSEAVATNSLVTGFVNVGFTPLDLTHATEGEEEYLGRLIVTESARWIFSGDYRFNRVPMRCPESPAQVAQGMYVAANNWGYELTSPTNPVTAASQVASASSTSQQALKSDWLGTAMNYRDDWCLALTGLSVTSDSEYLQVRSRLDESIRDAIDLYRFEALVPFVDSGDPFELLSIAPHWMLTSPIGCIDSTVRVMNVLTREGFQLCNDLLQVRCETALTWKGFGSKSLDEFAKSIRIAIHSRRLRGNGMSDRGTVSESLIDEPANLLDALNRSIEPLKERHREVFVRRLGLNGQPETLEAIGATLGITRERVRQIEDKCVRRFEEKESWPEVLRLKLEGLFSVKQEPLFVDLLGADDPWFAGFLDKPQALAQLIRLFDTSNAYVIEIMGRKLVSRISQDAWDILEMTALDDLGKLVFLQPSEEAIDQRLVELAFSHGAPELGGTLRTVLDDRLHFARRSGEESQVLVSIGRGVHHTINSVLAEAERPLHFTEITRLCSRKIGRELEVRYVHSRLVNSNAKIFGRGTYGTLTHFEGYDVVKDAILTEVDGIVLESTIDRQWHCSELMEKLEERRPDLPDYIDHYRLNMILQESQHLEDKGRFVWGSKVAKMGLAPNRIDIFDACVAVLLKAGRPLASTELRIEIERFRGVGSFFNIQGDERMARTEPGVWGLVDRDFALTATERQGYIETLLAVLHERQQGLHMSEIRAAVSYTGFSLPASLTDYMLMSLTQTDERLRLRKGQIVCPASWLDPKRVTVVQAVLEFENQMNNPMPFGAICTAVNERCGRSIPTREISAVLQRTSLVFDEDTKLWSKFEDGDEGVPLPGYVAEEIFQQYLPF